MRLEYNGNYELEIYPNQIIQEDNLDKVVTKVICQIGIPAKLLGYYYIRRGIVICLMEDIPMVSLGKVLYPRIAQEFKTETQKVERAVRHAIEAAWVRGLPDHFETVFGYSVKAETGKPTNAEFFAMIVDKMRLELSIQYVKNVE